jgi:hypothetical protein
MRVGRSGFPGRRQAGTIEGSKGVVRRSEDVFRPTAKRVAARICDNSKRPGYDRFRVKPFMP